MSSVSFKVINENTAKKLVTMCIYALVCVYRISYKYLYLCLSATVFTIYATILVK